MKTQSLFIGICISILVLGCNKPEEDEILFSSETSKVLSEGIALRTVSLQDLNSKNFRIETKELLSFGSMELFLQTIENLEKELQAHDDAFVNQYDHLTDEELDDIEEKLGFNDMEPLDHFEKKYGFSNSLRKKYIAEEEKWLNNEDLNELTDPDRKYNDFDITEMTLLNDQMEVMIKGVYYKFNSDGSYIINTDPLRPNSVPQLVESDIIEPQNFTDCMIGADIAFRIDPRANNKKLRLKIAVRKRPWKWVAYSKIESFKKKRRRWKKSRRRMKTRPYGMVYTPACDTPGEFSRPFKSRRSKRIKRRYSIPQALNANKTRPNQTFGDFYIGVDNYAHFLLPLD